MMWFTTGGKWGETPVLGYDRDNALWLFAHSGKYYLAPEVGRPLGVSADGEITGASYQTGALFNGKDIYTDVDGKALWYDGANRVLSTAVGMGTAEFYVDTGGEEVLPPTSPKKYVPVTRTWYGDTWYSKAGADPAGTYVARGANYSTPIVIKDEDGEDTGNTPVPGATKVLEFGKIVGHECATSGGFYKPVTDSGATGRKYVGKLWYRDPAHVKTPAVKKTVVVTTVATGAQTRTATYISFTWPLPANTTVNTEETITQTTYTAVNGITGSGALLPEGHDFFTDRMLEYLDNPVPQDSAHGLFLWKDGPDGKWIISGGMGTKTKRIGYWESAAMPQVTDANVSGAAVVFARVWEATPTTGEPNPPDTDANAFNLVLQPVASGNVFGETLYTKANPLAQVALWL